MRSKLKQTFLEQNSKTHPFSVRSVSDDTNSLFISFLLASGLATIKVCAVLQAVDIASSLIPSSLGLVERRPISSGSTCFAGRGGRETNIKKNMKEFMKHSIAVNMSL